MEERNHASVRAISSPKLSVPGFNEGKTAGA
jgi:hypothetical protein